MHSTRFYDYNAVSYRKYDDHPSLGRRQIRWEPRKVLLVRDRLTRLGVCNPHAQPDLCLRRMSYIVRPEVAVLTPAGVSTLICCVSVAPGATSDFDMACICNCWVWPRQHS